jgi:hypothetical protein
MKLASSTGAQAGKGRLGLIVALALCCAGIYAGVKVIPVRIAAYEFRDTLREQARYGATKASNRQVAEEILAKARELHIPLAQDQLSIERTKNEIVISARYEQPVDLKLTTYMYRFDATERAPLF